MLSCAISIVVVVHDGLLYLLGLYHTLEWIHVLLVLEVIFDDIVVNRRNTVVINPSLHLEEVITLSLKLLHKGLFLNTPEINFLLLLLGIAGSHALLLLQLVS